jgi:predicted small metal-binding protein
MQPQSGSAFGKTRLSCPCGAHIQGQSEDDLVAKVQEHLADAHPGRHYEREDILFMAY